MTRITALAILYLPLWSISRVDAQVLTSSRIVVHNGGVGYRSSYATSLGYVPGVQASIASYETDYVVATYETYSYDYPFVPLEKIKVLNHPLGVVPAVLPSAIFDYSARPPPVAAIPAPYMPAPYVPIRRANMARGR